jgi:hypothetical protein
MAIEIYSKPPKSLIAGDVYQWRDTPESIDDVTAYSVIFRSVNDGDISFTITGTDDSSHFSFEIQGADTASLATDEFAITKIITYTWGRESEESGFLTLLPNPTATPSESFNSRMVGLLESHIEGRLPEGLESHTIGGVPISKISLVEAQQLLAEYRGRLAHEIKADLQRRNPDEPTGNTIHIHF